MSDVMTTVAWIVLAVPAAILITAVGSRLLGTRRGWGERLVAGVLGWTAGLVIAGVLVGWQWSTWRMGALTLVFATLLSMVISVGLDMLATPGSLIGSTGSERSPARSPLRAMRNALAPVGRYRELVTLARSNGIHPRSFQALQPDDLIVLGPALRRTMEQAGGMFVKLGQVASTRSDLLPPELCEELAKLRSGAAPAPREQVQDMIEHELGTTVEQAFTAFDWEPIASASIAQVYAATLLTGDDVVVKVERPGIDAVIARDSAVLRQVAAGVDRHTSMGLTLDPIQLADEFIIGVREELDFTIEADNAAALAAATPAGLRVRVAQVHRGLSTTRILVEDRVEGVPISDVETLRERGIDPSELAERLTKVTLAQIFDAGVFHADPHPGNILVEPDGTIVLIDLGAVGRLGHRQRQVFIDLLIGAMADDATVIREALEDAGMVEGTRRTTELDAAIDQFLVHHVGGGTPIDTGLFEDLFVMLSTFSIQPPRWLTTLGRALVTLEGTLRQIDPGFSFIDSAVEVASSRLHGLPRPSSLRDSVEVEALKQLPRLKRLPQRIDDLLGQASRGRLSMRVSLLADKDDLAAVTKLVDRLVLAVLAAALGIGSTLLLNTQLGPTVTESVTVNEVIGYIGLAISTVLTLRIVASVIRDGVV